LIFAVHCNRFLSFHAVFVEYPLFSAALIDCGINGIQIRVFLLDWNDALMGFTVKVILYNRK